MIKDSWECISRESIHNTFKKRALVLQNEMIDTDDANENKMMIL